jgi:4-hydroxybenzoate polyprenyltransferase
LNRRLRVIHAYLLLPHAVPVIAVIATTAAFAVIAADGMPAGGKLADLLLAMLGAQVAIGAVNELVDANIDAAVKPTKPIPAGLVTRRGATVLAVFSLFVMVWFGVRLGWASLAVCALGTAAGVAYSLWFKRTLLAWLPYLVALPLLPIWVFTAVGRFDGRLLMLYPLGILAVVGVHLSQSLPDIAADRAAGIRNLTSVLGERMAFALCLATIVLSALSSVVAAAIWTDSATLAIAAATAAAVIVAVNVGLYLRRARTGVMACFPCVATGTAILGVGWVLAITR